MKSGNSLDRHSGACRNPASTIIERSGQNFDIVCYLRCLQQSVGWLVVLRTIFNQLDSGLRRNDTFFLMDYSA
jgi:hypothetical protein